MSCLIFDTKAPYNAGRNLQRNDFVDRFFTASYNGEFDQAFSSQFHVSNKARLNSLKVATIQDEVPQQTVEIGVTKRFVDNIECFPPPRSIFIAQNAVPMDEEKLRREKHNKYERKRRSLINAKITELGNMLPVTLDRASCNRKGSILRETVEYIKQLRTDQEMLMQMERKFEIISIEFRKISERIERLCEQSVVSDTNTDEDHMEEDVKQNDNPLDYNCLTKSSSTDRCISRDITTSVYLSCVQSKELHNELDSVSSFLSDDSSIYFQSPKFSDTMQSFLSNSFESSEN